MTIAEALNLVDELKPNNVDRERKIGWLSDLDMRVFGDVFVRHEQDEKNPEAFSGYTAETDDNTELLIREPHCEVYRWFLEMQIDLANMELAKYNNSMALFLSAWKDFAGMYHRTHMPLCNVNFKY